MEKIGQRIRDRRMELGISSTSIQRNFGVSSGNLSAIEKGTVCPSVKTLIQLSIALNCSIDWIVTGSSNEKEDLSEIEKELIQTFRNIESFDRDEIIALLRMKGARVSNKGFSDSSGEVGSG